MYAFGVLLWELWCSAGAWSGMSQAQVIAAILVRGRKLEFPPGTPGDYQVRTLALVARPQLTGPFCLYTPQSCIGVSDHHARPWDATCRSVPRFPAVQCPPA